MTRSRLLLAFLGVTGSTATVLACVDLFHATEFATLCAPDATACTDAELDAPETDAGTEDVDAALEPIDFCTLTPAEALAEAEHACAWLTACQPTIGGSSPGACMRQALLALDCRINPVLRPTPKSAHLWACLTRAKSCEDVAQCAFGGENSASSCAGGITGERCVNGNVVRCDKSKLTGIDVCALGGKSCTRNVNRAECTGAAGSEDCRPNRCIGSWATVCVDGKDEGYDCATVGKGACVDGACAPGTRAEPCKVALFECDPSTDKVKGCVDKRTVEIDCRALGGRCDPSRLVAGDPARACTGPGTDCGPLLCQENANGFSDYARGCDRGIYFTLACSAASLSSCDAGRCTP